MSLPRIKDTSGIPVLWRDDPLDLETRPKYALVQPHSGRMPTLAEIVESIDDLPDDIRLDGVARINGEPVPKELWHLVRPKYIPGRVVVTLHHSMGKGGNVGSVLAIGALIAATLISGGAAAPLLGGVLGLSGTALTIATSALAAGVGVLGSLAASALAPPPTSPDDPTSNVATGPEIRNATLGGNGVSKGSPIQRVIGTYKLSPQAGTDVLYEQIGWDIWAERTYVLQGPHKIEAIYFDGVLQDGTNPNAFVEIREGWPDDEPSTLINRQSKSDGPISLSKHKINTSLPAGSNNTSRLSDSAEAFNDPVVQNTWLGGPQDASRSIDVTRITPEWHRFTTRSAPDEFWVLLTFEGLFDTKHEDDAGGTPFRLRMRRLGDATWINLPELHVANKLISSFRLTVKLKWQEAPASISKPPDDKGPGFYIAFYSAPGQSISPTTADWISDSWFFGGSVVNSGRDRALSHLNHTTTNVRNVLLFEDRAEIYLGGSAFDHGAGTSDVWEIEMKQGIFYRPVDFMANTDSPGSYVYNTDFTSPAIYDFFHYRNVVANDYRVPNDVSGARWNAAIQARSTIWNENPLPTTDLCKIFVKVRNQSINEVKVLASGYIPRFNGVDWSIIGTSSIPAENYRYVLTSELGKLPQDTDTIDAQNLADWYQYCVDNDLTIDTVVAGKSYRDVIRLICAAGWARERDSEQWSVIYDYDRSEETPGQIFTAREVSEVSIRKPFSRMPDGFRATFVNADDDYTQDSLVVLDPFNPDATEDGVEEVAYAAFTDATKVAARALFDIKQAYKRNAVFSWRTDWLSVMSERGDLVGLNYDTFSPLAADSLGRGYGSARIKSIELYLGNISIIHLDGTVKLWYDDVLGSDDILVEPDVLLLGSVSGATQTARIRKLSGAGYLDFQIYPANGNVNYLIPATVIADPGSSVIAEDCMVWVGVSTSTELRLIVTSVTPSNNYEAVITAVREAPEIWA